MKINALPLFLALSILINCQGGGDSNSSVLAILAARKCISVPRIIIYHDEISGYDTDEFHCSVSGTKYNCLNIDDDRVWSRTYESVSAVSLGVIDPPSVAFGFGVQVAQRGLLELKSHPSANPSIVNDDYTFTYDSFHQLLSSTDVVGGGTITFSNYDINGFPLDISGGGSIAYQYNYSPTLPSAIFSDSVMFYDANGWINEVSDGGSTDVSFHYPGGTLQLCE
ncbi:hypothetical protein EHQ53_13870 [Leptospira langatensis]|uniref:Uncharacterized protein n=1 Tax=Leptospira langatensis TaxID=2484983 RepID=A0A5F1ZT30_9LEPT|nr:hypothetical protein [Leptospira langatensis]TGK02550.1 hypothetical protein EHO57_04245 [Leptospira langatensis]TGL40249.1 hypothetical protein EHQ53_13870 [Leptospira langatensis]